MGEPLNSPLSFYLNHLVDPDRAYAVFVDEVDTCLPIYERMHRQGYPLHYLTMQWTEPNPAWQGWELKATCFAGSGSYHREGTCLNPYHLLLNRLERTPRPGSYQIKRGGPDDWLEWEYEDEYPDRLELFKACLDGTIPAFANVYTLAQYRREHAEAEGSTGILYKPRTANQPFRRWEGKQVTEAKGTRGSKAQS